MPTLMLKWAVIWKTICYNLFNDVESRRIERLVPDTDDCNLFVPGGEIDFEQIVNSWYKTHVILNIANYCYYFQIVEKLV